MRRFLLSGLMLLVFGVAFGQKTNDWAYFSCFAEENAALTKAPIAVFMGNSITQNWRNFHPDYFSSHNYAGRGIGGQVTSQMLCRFRADVLDLHPKVVVIFAGTNDIAQNDGAISVAHIMDNIKSMAELAMGHKIKVILCSVTPVAETGYPWRPKEFNESVKPNDKIQALNALIKAYAKETKCDYVDFWTPMANEKGAMKTDLSKDGCHPNPDAYFAMEELVTPIIEKRAK